MTVGVIVFENNLGKKQYQPAFGSVAKHWKTFDGRGAWLDRSRERHFGYNPCLYKSEKRALRIARREVNRRQRSQSKNYYRTGEEK